MSTGTAAGRAQRLLRRWWAAPHVRLLAGLFLVALVVRALWFAAFPADPRDGRVDDTVHYHLSATVLKHELRYVGLDRDPTAAWPPGYPAFVAGLYLVAESPRLGQAVNVALGAATVLLVYALGRDLFSRGVGLAGAGVLALFPNHIWFSGLLMTEVPFAFLTTLFLWLTVRWTLGARPPRPAHLLALGLLAGAITLVRAEMGLAFLPVGLAWLASTRSLGRTVRYVLLAGVGVALVVLPWTARNAATMGYPIAVSTGMGDLLVAGHWPGADGAGTFEAGREIARRYEHLDNPEREVARYRANLDAAVDYAIHHPAEEVKLIPKRLYHLFGSDHDGLTWMLSNRTTLGPRVVEWLSWGADAYYLAVLGIAAVGLPLWVTWRDPRRLLPVLWVLYIAGLFGLLFVGNPRYHMSVVPILSLAAGVTLAAVWGNLPALRRAVSGGETGTAPPPS